MAMAEEEKSFRYRPESCLKKSSSHPDDKEEKDTSG